MSRVIILVAALGFVMAAVLVADEGCTSEVQDLFPCDRPEDCQDLVGPTECDEFGGAWVCEGGFCLP